MSTYSFLNVQLFLDIFVVDSSCQVYCVRVIQLYICIYIIFAIEKQIPIVIASFNNSDEGKMNVTIV